MAMGGLPFRGQWHFPQNEKFPLKTDITGSKSGSRKEDIVDRRSRAERTKRSEHGAGLAIAGEELMGGVVSQWAVPTGPAETADSAVACVLGFFDALARNLAPIEPDAQKSAIDLPERRAFGRQGHHRLSHPRSPACGATRREAPHGRAPAHRRPRAEDRPEDELLRPTAVSADRVAEMVGARAPTARRPSSSIWAPPPPSNFLDEAGAFRGGIIAQA